MIRLLFPLLLAGCLAVPGLVKGQPIIQLDSTTLEARVVADHLNLPWDLVWGPDGYLWFTDRVGGIHRMNADDGTIEEILVVDEVFNSWDNSGMHALAIHPRFPTVPFLYVNYTYGQFAARVVRYSFDVKAKTLTNPVTIIGNLRGNSSHNGSRMLFDEEEALYLTTGDAFNSALPQDLDEENGKILKMDGDGVAWPGNPFNSRIWSYGHRNPQGLAFGPEGRLYSSEHGVAADDELNLVEKGRNYGWPRTQGFCDLPSEGGFCDSNWVKEPLMVWTPADAPSGLDYFDHESVPEWKNSLIQVFLKAKRFSLLRLNSSGTSVMQELFYLENEFGRLRDVLVTPTGRIFLCTSNREANGADVVQADDDKIIELVNPDYDYPEFIPQVVEFNARLYPIPSEDKLLTLVFEDNEGPTIQINLFDASGRYLHTWYDLSTNSISTTLNLTSFQAGVYYLEVISSVNGTSRKPIILN